MLTCLVLAAAFLSAFGQLDTANLAANRWVNIWPVTTPVSISGDNGNYENDFNGDPHFGFMVMGPGHVVHPQDCMFYPYDPVRNKWTKIDPPFYMPRTCISTFCLSAQDSAIIWQWGAEGSHQFSQGAFTSGYDAITATSNRGVQLAVYSFNRNRWYDMAGPHVLPPTVYHQRVRYDPVHDIAVRLYSGEIWVYNFHNNEARSYSGGQSGSRAAAVDARRGLVYFMSGGSLRVFNPETGVVSPGVLSGSEPLSVGQYDVESMDYDPLHDVILFLSDPDCTPTGSTASLTWAFHCDTRQWEELSAADCPLNRGRLAFNRALNALVMLGGGGTCQIGEPNSLCLACPRGLWAYRYQSGPGVEAGMIRAPDAGLAAGGGGVRLDWEDLSGAGASGYNVYRGEGDPFPRGFVKLNGQPVSGTSYTDASAVSGHAYSYRVCGVKSGVEGHLSRHLYTRPARVLGVVASVADSSGITVSWERNSEPDLAGYIVYRARAASIYGQSMSGYTRLNSTPVTDTFFNDMTAGYAADPVARGYVVKAVGAFGCTSGVSDVGTTFPWLPERAWTIGQSTAQGMKMALRWQPPRRARILGVNLYRCTHPPTKQNLSGPITDTSVTLWPMPPSTGGTGYELIEQTYILRAVNIFGQEGFNTDMFSPINTEYGYGVVPTAQRFDFNLYRSQAPGSLERGGGAAGAPFLQAWPNPFRPVTILSVTPAAGRAAIEITLYDLRGALIQQWTVAPGPGARRVSWDGRDAKGAPVAAGVYLVKARLGAAIQMKRLIRI